jgi:hypothetical protein
VIERLLLENHDPVDLAAAALELLATSGAGIRRASRPAGSAAPTPVPVASVITSRQGDDRPTPARVPALAGVSVRETAADVRRPHRDLATARTDVNADRPGWDIADFERRRPDGDPLNRPKKRVHAQRETAEAGRGGTGVGRKPAKDRRTDAAPERKPRPLVKGAKSWERRPKPGAPAHPKRPR